MISFNNPDAANATYTQGSLALGLSVEQCLKLAALFEWALEQLPAESTLNRTTPMEKLIEGASSL